MPTMRNNVRILTDKITKSLNSAHYWRWSTESDIWCIRRKRWWPTQSAPIFSLYFAWHWNTCACKMQSPIHMCLCFEYRPWLVSIVVYVCAVHAATAKFVRLFTFENGVPARAWTETSIYEACIALPEEPQHAHVRRWY